MRPLILAAAIAVALPLGAGAQTYRAVNNLNVIPLDHASFEVIEARGEGPRGMWCAAADYAERRLRANGRIYIRDARGPSRSISGRKSVVFTTNAGALEQGPFQSVSLDTSQVGIGLPIGHAIQFCRRDVSDFTDRVLRRK